MAGNMRSSYSPAAIWGKELRHLRKKVGLTQNQLAIKIHYSESLISQIETGQTPATLDFAESCDAALGTDGLLVRLLDWRKDQVIPVWFAQWRETEQIAVTLREYEPMTVPGLLQIESYAGAILGGDDAAVEARLARQSLLTREQPDPPTIRCVIDESVLHRPIGGAETMRRQLLHLLEVYSHILTVQVLPYGVREGLFPAFSIATLPSGIDVLYAATAVKGMTTNDLQDVAVAVARFEAIRGEALPVSMSKELIMRAVDERWT